MKTTHHYQGPLYAATIIPEEFRARSVAGFNRLLERSGEYQPVVFKLLDDLALHTQPELRVANVYRAYRSLADLLPENIPFSRKRHANIHKYVAQQYEELDLPCQPLPQLPPSPPCKYEARREYVRSMHSEANSLV